MEYCWSFFTESPRGRFSLVVAISVVLSVPIPRNCRLRPDGLDWKLLVEECVPKIAKLWNIFLKGGAIFLGLNLLVKFWGSFWFSLFLCHHLYSLKDSGLMMMILPELLLLLPLLPNKWVKKTIFIGIFWYVWLYLHTLTGSGISFIMDFIYFLVSLYW